MSLKLKLAGAGVFLALLLVIGEPPAWLLKGEVLIVATFALVYGFTAFSPRLPAFMKYQEVRGVVLVALGGAALFVPAQFVVSALLVGLGARLVMTSQPPPPPAAKPSTVIVRGQGGSVPRPASRDIIP